MKSHFLTKTSIQNWFGDTIKPRGVCKMNDEQFEELDIFQVASLLWKTKRMMNPVVIDQLGIVHQITDIECLNGDIYINIEENKVLNDHRDTKTEVES